MFTYANTARLDMKKEKKHSKGWLKLFIIQAIAYTYVQ